MTKKHFIALAKIILDARESAKAAKDSAAYFQATDLALEMAAFCAEQNPRFDRQKFLSACGL